MIELEQFLIGSLLGDAAFVKKSENRNTYVVFKHAENQLGYLKWKRQVMLEYNLTDDNHKGVVEVFLKDGTCYPNHQRQFKFATISSPHLNKYKEMSDEAIAERFERGALAIWVLDDGGVHNKRVKISCGSISKHLALMLVEKMQNEFGLDCYYYENPKSTTKNCIVIRAESFEDLHDIVNTFVPTDADVVCRKFQNEVQIQIKYHADIEPVNPEQPNSDWIDLRAAETVELKQGEFRIISLGVSMRLPYGYEAHIIPRSSTFKNFGILLANSYGLIDNSYCGEADIWGFPAIAMRDTVVHKGDRICQFRIMQKQPKLVFAKVEHLEGKSRGGFGSTGVK